MIDKQLEEAMFNITDTFMGGDGGVKFAIFNAAMKRFVKEALEGKEDSLIVVKLVIQFSKIIDACQPKT
jgi:hypothetical protein